MACRCKNAYRKNGDVSVHCLAIAGDNDYCGHQYSCPVTGQWEVNCSSECTLKTAPPVKTAPKRLSLI